MVLWSSNNNSLKPYRTTFIPRRHSSSRRQLCSKRSKMAISRDETPVPEVGTMEGNADWKHAAPLSRRDHFLLFLLLLLLLLLPPPQTRSRERERNRLFDWSNFVGGRGTSKEDDVVDVVIPRRKFSAGLIESTDTLPPFFPPLSSLLPSLCWHPGGLRPQVSQPNPPLHGGGPLFLTTMRPR